MGTISRARVAFHVDVWSMKKIARELHVSRNTVRKIVRSNETDFTYERANQPFAADRAVAKSAGTVPRFKPGASRRESG